MKVAEKKRKLPKKPRKTFERKTKKPRKNQDLSV